MLEVLVLLKGIYGIFMIFHRHIELELVMMGKREKLLAIYDAIPPRVMEEMALQLLFDPPKFYNRVWRL